MARMWAYIGAQADNRHFRRPQQTAV